jgi:hypothetical protein
VQQAGHIVRRGVEHERGGLVRQPLVAGYRRPERPARGVQRIAHHRRARRAGRGPELARVEQRLRDAGEAACIAHAAFLPAQRLDDGAPLPSLEALRQPQQAVEERRNAPIVGVAQELDGDDIALHANERSCMRPIQHVSTP